MVSKSVPKNMRQISVLVEQQQPRCESFYQQQECSDSPDSATTTTDENTVTQPNSERSSTSTSSERFSDECCDVASPSSSSATVPLAPSPGTNGFMLPSSANSQFWLSIPNFSIPNSVTDEKTTAATTGVRPSKPVWMPQHRKYAPSLEGLHDEIRDLHYWLKPTAEEIAYRRKLFNQISALLRKKLWHDAEISMYGSVATTSFLPSSDIDICVQTPNGELHVPEDLHRVADVLKETNDFENIIVLDKTVIPIVKCTDRQTQLSIDLSFNLSHVADTVKWIREKIADLPLLEPLLLLLKQFLAQQGLNNPFNGGLPSYALVVMLVYFLEVGDDIVRFPRQYEGEGDANLKKSIRYDNKNLMKMKNPEYAIILGRRPLGVLFHYFLYYYGYTFDFVSCGIRVVPRLDLVLKEELAMQFNDDPCTSGIWIADPVAKDNNIGKGAHNLMAIKFALMNAYNNIMQTLSILESVDESCRSCYWGPMLSLIIHFDDATVARRAQNIAISRKLFRLPQWLPPRQRYFQRRRLQSVGMLPRRERRAKTEEDEEEEEGSSGGKSCDC